MTGGTDGRCSALDVGLLVLNRRPCRESDMQRQPADIGNEGIVPKAPTQKTAQRHDPSGRSYRAPLRPLTCRPQLDKKAVNCAGVARKREAHQEAPFTTRSICETRRKKSQHVYGHLRCARTVNCGVVWTNTDIARGDDAWIATHDVAARPSTYLAFFYAGERKLRHSASGGKWRLSRLSAKVAVASRHSKYSVTRGAVERTYKN